MKPKGYCHHFLKLLIVLILGWQGQFHGTCWGRGEYRSEVEAQHRVIRKSMWWQLPHASEKMKHIGQSDCITGSGKGLSITLHTVEHTCTLHCLLPRSRNVQQSKNKKWLSQLVGQSDHIRIVWPLLQLRGCGNLCIFYKWWQCKPRGRGHILIREPQQDTRHNQGILYYRAGNSP